MSLPCHFPNAPSLNQRVYSQVQVGAPKLSLCPAERRPNTARIAWSNYATAGRQPRRLSFTSERLWQKDEPLVESGLLGPVTIQKAE